MFAGCILILPVIFTLITGSGLFSARWKETPELFVSMALMPFVTWFAILLAACIVAMIAFKVGQRNREVVLDGKTVLIQWGVRMPLTLRRIEAHALGNFSIAKEARYAVNARSNGHYGMSARPDRWRVKAVAHGRTVDLGSYATEDEARRAIAAVQSA